MSQEKMAVVENLFQVESREVRVLSVDETTQVGGAFVFCTLPNDSVVVDTTQTPDITL